MVSPLVLLMTQICFSGRCELGGYIIFSAKDA
jgi:hypothetical protein